MQEFEQHPSEARLYKVRFEDDCARKREPDTDYTTGTRARPMRGNGYQYNASTGGRTGTTEPRWPTTVGATVQDGSVTWTCEAISVAGQNRTLSSAAWSGTTGITIGASSESGTSSTALVSGGVAGQDYDITVVGTTSDSEKPVKSFRVKVRNPAYASEV